MISIQEQESLQIYLKLIKPMISRQLQCDLLLEYVEHRLQSEHHAQYTDLENSIYYQLKEQNQ